MGSVNPTYEIMGRVKFFNDVKGFGFAVPDCAAVDVMIHHSVITGLGNKRLVPNQRVFMIVEDRGSEGFRALQVTPLDMSRAEATKHMSENQVHGKNIRRELD